MILIVPKERPKPGYPVFDHLVLVWDQSCGYGSPDYGFVCGGAGKAECLGLKVRKISNLGVVCGHIYMMVNPYLSTHLCPFMAW